MRNSKAHFCAMIVDLVQHGRESEAINRYGFTNISKACKSFPKDKQVQTSFSKIEQEFFKPIDWEFFDILEDISKNEDFAL